jgi:hypothetical protein
MINRIIFILNFFSEEFNNDYSSQFNDKILSICSILIHLFIKTYSNPQISIILVKNGHTQQLSHFSGNNFHQYQGLYRAQVKNSQLENNLRSAFFLALKLFKTNPHNEQNEIVLLNEGQQDASFFHSIGGRLLKKKLKLSLISFNRRNYFLEILTKITGGVLIFINSKNKIFLNLFLRLNITEKRKYFNCSFLVLKNFKTIFFFKTKEQNRKKNLFSEMKKICDNCYVFLKSYFAYFCPNCWILGAENDFFFGKYLKNIDFFFLKNSTKKKFSIFSLFFSSNKLIEKTRMKIFNCIGKIILSDFLSFPKFYYRKEKRFNFVGLKNKEIFSNLIS